MRKIKIALFSINKDTYSETFIQNHRRLFDGDVIFYSNGYIPKENDVEGELVNTHSIKYKLLRLAGKTYKEILKYEIYRSLIRNKIDVCYIEYGTCAVEVMPILKKAKIPFVVNFHGYDITTHRILNKNEKLYKELFKNANVVVGVSKLMCRMLEDMGCPKNKIFYNPCSPQKMFYNIKPEFNNNQIISIGRFVDKKAPYLIVLAFKEVKKVINDATLIMIGDGPLLNVVRNIIEVYDIPDVKLLNALTHDQVYENVKNSYLFVQHSVTPISGDMEGTPVSVMEASLAGLPVVSTLHGGIPDVIMNQESGILVEELDLKGMVNAIIMLLKNRSYAKKMGQIGKELIMKNLSEKIHKERLNKSIKLAMKEKYDELG